MFETVFDKVPAFACIIKDKVYSVRVASERSVPLFLLLPLIDQRCIQILPPAEVQE